MDLIDMTTEDRYDMMRKRHAFLHETVRQYTSLETFANERDDWFAIRGIELTLYQKCITLYMSLGYDEYETYYIISGDNGQLAVSEVVGWQDPWIVIEELPTKTRKVYSTNTDFWQKSEYVTKSDTSANLLCQEHRTDSSLHHKIRLSI